MKRNQTRLPHSITLDGIDYDVHVTRYDNTANFALIIGQENNADVMFGVATINVDEPIHKDNAVAMVHPNADARLKQAFIDGGIIDPHPLHFIPYNDEHIPIHQLTPSVMDCISDAT